MQLSEDRSKLSARFAAKDQLQKLEIRTPQDGSVYQFTVGGVLGAGEPITWIVPSNDIHVIRRHRAERGRPQDQFRISTRCKPLSQR